MNGEIGTFSQLGIIDIKMSILPRSGLPGNENGRRHVLLLQRGIRKLLEVMEMFI